MESWPSMLPNPDQAYQINPESMVIENEFEAGPKIQRLRFDDHIDNVRVQWTFDQYNFALFKQWFATKLAHGTKKFTMTIPLGGLDGVEEYECEFSSARRPYRVRYQAVNYFKVQADLFVDDFNFISDAALSILLEEYPEQGDSFISAVDRLDSFVEQNLTD